MRVHSGILLVAALLLTPTPSILAQVATDPSGHWEGTVKTPTAEIAIEIDLAKTAGGEFGGAFGQPAQRVKGLPLSAVAVESRSVRFVIKGGPEPAAFAGLLADDGTSIAGTITQAGASLPLTLKRTGEASIAPAPKSSPIAKELEGTWNGTIEVSGQEMRLVVKMANHADGTATGTVMSPDGSGVEIPIAMKQAGATLTLEVAAVGATFVGTLNASRTEAAGTWSQGGGSVPLTLRLVKP